MTFGEWAAAWWEWALAAPADESPLLDETGEFGDRGQSGPVWFLGGTWGAGGAVDRAVTVPAGKSLFFPIVNFVWVQTPYDPPFDEDALRDFLASTVDSAVDLSCEIDGMPVGGLDLHRFQSPLFTANLPEWNLLDYSFNQFGFEFPAGEYAPCLDDGYYLMLAPLPAGEHTIHFAGGLAAAGFVLDVTYHLTVTGGK